MIPRPPATRDQADAHRYGLRRLEAALVRADPVPLHEQLRSQRRATVVGAVLAVLGLVAMAVYATFSPRPEWSRQSIVVGAPSGAVFAVLHDPDRLVPVVDAVAARLVLAASGEVPGEPRLVPDDDLATAARTAPAAVDGATGVRPAPLPGGWGVCDGPDGVVVLAGVAAPGGARRDGTEPGGVEVRDVWARTPGGDEFAVVDGVRHAVGDPSARAGLGLTGRRPVTVAAAVLSVLPEGPAFALPELVDGPGPVGVPGRPGDVLRTTSVDGVTRLVAVVPGGVQEVPVTVAEVLRARGGAGPREVAPAVVAEAPQREVLPVSGWPAATPLWDAPSAPLCTLWSDDRWHVTGEVPPVAAGATRVGGVLVGAGGAVRASSPTGGGTVWLVSAAGVAHGVADAATATALGLPPALPEVPESLLRLLPRGAVIDLAQAAGAGTP